MRSGSTSGAATGSGACDLADARWFPVDVHVPQRKYQFLAVAPHVLEHSTFLDDRIAAPLHEAVSVDLQAIAQTVLPAAPVAWLLHTSFCCSTLLARMLHLPRYQVVLKEPLVLRRIGNARHAQWNLEGLIEPTMRLLARPWHLGGAVVIKPTHAALNSAVDMMNIFPDSRGIILTSSLDDFLVSNVKKTRETQAKIPTLVERALQASRFSTRLPPQAFAPPNLLAAAALQWAAQRELCLDILTFVGGQRLRIVDAAELLGDLESVTWQCAQWLQLPAPQSSLELRINEISHQNAKAIGTTYNAQRRVSDILFIKARWGAEIAEARRWFDRIVMPAMRVEAFAISKVQET